MIRKKSVVYKNLIFAKRHSEQHHRCITDCLKRRLRIALVILEQEVETCQTSNSSPTSVVISLLSIQLQVYAYFLARSRNCIAKFSYCHDNVLIAVCDASVYT